VNIAVRGVPGLGQDGGCVSGLDRLSLRARRHRTSRKPVRAWDTVEGRCVHTRIPHSFAVRKDEVHPDTIVVLTEG
jgi:hypothetical protein